MIQNGNDIFNSNFQVHELPSKTYKLNVTSETIVSYTDNLEAMKQAIFLILNIERYEHIIYSWNYGVELADLIGQPISFVLPEIKRRIEEALLQDSRIKSVESFKFEVKKGVVYTTFNVKTSFGEISTEKAVNI